MKNLSFSQKIVLCFFLLFSSQNNLFCKHIKTVCVPNKMPTSVAWWNNLLCVGSMDGSVDLLAENGLEFDIVFPEEQKVFLWGAIKKIESHGNFVTDIASNGSMLVTAKRDYQADESVLTYFFSQEDLEGHEKRIKGAVKTLALNAYGRAYVVIVFSNGNVKLLNRKSNQLKEVFFYVKEARFLGFDAKKICSLALHGSELAVGCGGKVFLFDCNFSTGACSFRDFLQPFQNSVCTALERKGNIFIAGSSHGEIKVFRIDYEFLRPKFTFWRGYRMKNKTTLHSLSLSDEGILASVTFNGKIDLWDLSRLFKKKFN